MYKLSDNNNVKQIRKCTIMLMGIKLHAKPTQLQRQVLSQWMGCARFIWNPKCEEERYHTRFARKYYPIGIYAPIDQKYSQCKSKELS